MSSGASVPKSAYIFAQRRWQGGIQTRKYRCHTSGRAKTYLQVFAWMGTAGRGLASTAVTHQTEPKLICPYLSRGPAWRGPDSQVLLSPTNGSHPEQFPRSSLLLTAALEMVASPAAQTPPPHATGALRVISLGLQIGPMVLNWVHGIGKGIFMIG